MDLKAYCWKEVTHVQRCNSLAVFEVRRDGAIIEQSLDGRNIVDTSELHHILEKWQFLPILRSALGCRVFDRDLWRSCISLPAGR